MEILSLESLNALKNTFNLKRLLNPNFKPLRLKNLNAKLIRQRNLSIHLKGSLDLNSNQRILLRVRRLLSQLLSNNFSSNPIIKLKLRQTNLSILRIQLSKKNLNLHRQNAINYIIVINTNNPLISHTSQSLN